MRYVERAKEICMAAHAGQVDKGGAPYYLHPFAVAEMCETDDEKIVAYLHDVFEDTDTSIGDCEFKPCIIEALKLLTKDPNQSYGDYIDRLKSNDLARAVKINDLTHNSDLSRLKTVTNKDIERVQKYQYYIEVLKNAK